MLVSEAIAHNWPNATLSVACAEDCEGGFSWSPCDTCDSRLGGDRHPVSAHGEDHKHYDLQVCVDCLMFLANGEDAETA